MYKKLVLSVLIAIFALFTNGIHAQELIKFSFRNNSSTLVANYLNNQCTIHILDSLMKINKDEIVRGTNFITLSGWLTSKYDKLPAINNASVQASVVRAYMKQRYGLTDSNFRFFVDQPQSQDNVVVINIGELVENSHIFYTLSRDPKLIAAAMAKYGKPMPVYTLYGVSAEENPEIIREEPPVQVHNYQVKEDVQPDLSTPKASDKTIFSDGVQENGDRFAMKRVLKPYVAFKTNLIQWAGILPTMQYSGTYIPNLGIEFFMGNFVSLLAEGSWADQTLKSGTNHQEMMYKSGIAELRFWVASKGKFNGFFIGPYVHGGDYQIKYDRISSDLGYKGRFCGGGISLGVTALMSQSLALELSLRGGYFRDNQSPYATVNNRPYSANLYGDKQGYRFDGINVNFVWRIGKFKNKMVENRW